MTAKKLQEKLLELQACPEAIEFCKGKTLAQAWKTCERADWMLWWLDEIEYDRKIIIGLTCDCAENALKYVPKDEKRPRIAIETTRAYLRGQATLEQVINASYAASSAAYYASSADSYAAYYASSAAAYAAHTVYAAHTASCAAYAADTASCAAYAADTASCAAVDAVANKIMCDIIKLKVPNPEKCQEIADSIKEGMK